MKGIYLCACKARHKDYDITYNDIDEKYGCDLTCDMFQCDILGYDYIIASPPCNYWSKANPYYEKSKYSAMTRNLLPNTILWLRSLNKPFIIENVINRARFEKNGIYQIANPYIYIYMRSVGIHILQM